MFENQRIAFVGGGNMGAAMIQGLLAKGLVQPEQLIVADPSKETRARLAQGLGVETTADNEKAAVSADVIIVAVKPQFFKYVVSDLAGKLDPDALVISIMAGTTMEQIRSGLVHNEVVRAMPNTPAMVGHGMSGWTASAAVSDAQREVAAAVLGSFGEQVYLPEEKYLDMVTAVSGSGPGYIFLILEAMIDAGVQMGLMRPVAEKLVFQTMLGSVNYALASDSHLAVLRNQVTSPGGTTAAGLAAMERGGLRTTLAEGILAAYEKSVALGK